MGVSHSAHTRNSGRHSGTRSKHSTQDDAHGSMCESPVAGAGVSAATGALAGAGAGAGESAMAGAAAIAGAGTGLDARGRVGA